MKSNDEQAARLVRALERYDLDTSWPLIRHGYGQGANAAAVLSHLGLLVGRAAAEHVRLLSPPDDFREWAVKAASTNRDGRPASLATVRTRLTHLKTLYRVLQEYGVLAPSYQPLGGLALPTPAPAHHRPFTAEELARLDAHARTEAVRVALRLTARHALTLGEVANLRWEDLDLERGLLLRRHVQSRLSPDLTDLLVRYAAEAGGVLHARGPVFGAAHDLRRQFWRSCRAANVEYRPWSEARLAAIRDGHGRLSPTDLGYHVPGKLAEMARILAEQAAPPAADPGSS